MSSVASLLGGGLEDGSERSTKQLYEEAVLSRRNAMRDLKVAREETELLKNQNRVLEQRISRMLQSPPPPGLTGQDPK